MKAPAFQWYAAEYLADERVAQLSLESEAVYVRLLSYCWREGTIPANPAQCAPLCKYADVKVIKPALALFMKVPGQSGRLIHKRLEEERAKQQTFKDKQVINGKLGGRPRKPNDNPDESQTKGLGYSGLTQTEPKKRSSTSSSISPANTADAVTHEAAAANLASENEKLTAELAGLKAGLAATPDRPALPAKTPKEMAALLAGDNDLYTAATVPMLNDARLFGIVLARYGVGECDQAHYMREIRATCESKQMQAGVSQFEGFIKTYLKNDAASKTGLVKPVASSQPKGKAVNEIQFELNPTAVARRRREREEMELSILTDNLDRINRNEGTNYTVAQFLAQAPTAQTHPTPNA